MAVRETTSRARPDRDQHHGGGSRGMSLRCTGCTGCTRCTGCTGCTRCPRCTGCTGCTGCTRCTRCDKVRAQGAQVHKVRWSARSARMRRPLHGICGVWLRLVRAVHARGRGRTAFRGFDCLAARGRTPSRSPCIYCHTAGRKRSRFLQSDPLGHSFGQNKHVRRIRPVLSSGVHPISSDCGGVASGDKESPA